MTEAVSNEMRKTIEGKLKEIVAAEDVTIIHAIESGSRAWGFHSPDSDYDVRFIYTRPVDWFLKLGKKRDVIERPIDDLLDISGWQLDKALGLALKGNAVLTEWLQSPIIYQTDDTARGLLEDFTRKAATPRPLLWHYLSLAEQHEKRTHLENGRVRLKRLFYALRPALALRWMQENALKMPPMNMEALCAGISLNPTEIDAIDRLVTLKIARAEKATSDAPDPVIFEIIGTSCEATRNLLKSLPEDQDHSALVSEANRLHKRLTKGVS